MQPRDLVINERLSQPRCPWRGICTLAGLLAFLALLSAPQHSDRPSSTLQSISLTVPAGLRPAGTHLGSDDDVAVLAPVKTAPHGTPPLSRLPQSRPPPKAQLSPPPSAFPPPAPATATPVALVQQPLPNCSVLFFHHLEKTAGTTLRSVLQRHAQLGLFDFVSFVNRYNKVQFQMVTHRVDEALRTPGGLSGLRLAVEIHIGGGGCEQSVTHRCTRTSAAPSPSRLCAAPAPPLQVRAVPQVHPPRPAPPPLKAARRRLPLQPGDAAAPPAAAAPLVAPPLCQRARAALLLEQPARLPEPHVDGARLPRRAFGAAAHARPPHRRPGDVGRL